MMKWLRLRKEYKLEMKAALLKSYGYVVYKDNRKHRRTQVEIEADKAVILKHGKDYDKFCDKIEQAQKKDNQ